MVLANFGKVNHAGEGAMSDFDSTQELWGELAGLASEAVATLSQATVSPQGYDNPGSPREPDDVDFFDAGSWITGLLHVQDWMKLEAPIDASSPDAAVASLATMMLRNPTRDDSTKLPPTEELLTALVDRLNQAIRLQEAFIDDVDDNDISIDEASRRWEAGWETVDTAERSSGPVHAKTDVWNINDFVSRVRQGNFELNPSFQRSDVWPNGDSQLLIESVIRGIPLPSVIVLKPEGQEAMQVVDGKQRLTAILRFVGEHPVAIEKVRQVQEKHPDVDFLRLFREDYPRFRRAWKAKEPEPLSATKEREFYFPFKLKSGSSSTLIGDLERLQGKYFSQIRSEAIEIAGDRTTIENIFTQSTEYKIPIINYQKASQRQIHEVFGLYNKQGKQLNAEEIRNAVFHHLDFARAVLVCAGDNTDVATVAPALLENWDLLSTVGVNLSDYGFGIGRFKRSKVLSWVLAHLVVDTMEDDQPRKLSTANLINEMYRQVSAPRKPGQKPHPLAVDQGISGLLSLAAQGIQAHMGSGAWAPRFRHSQDRPKWEELQLVGSLLGVMIATVQFGDEVEDRLVESADSLLKLTSTESFKRPKKTQTSDQWDAIALWSISIARELGADVEACDKTIRTQYGSSGVASLMSIANKTG